ncbi:PTS sugar transporter subunit IIB [bacterium]|nr:PTS sugar transporter subunit IIB [bacterium]
MPAELVLVRIDDRLIHGQVAVGWVKATSPDFIIVADDTVAKDTLQKTLMKMAATAAFGVKICKVEALAALMQSAELSGKRLLLLFSSSQDVVRAMQSGVKLTKLNVGGLRYCPGKQQIMKAIAINQDDVRNFQEINRQGVRVSIQMVPTDEPVDIMKYL